MEETAIFSIIVYLILCGFCSEGLPLSLGVWDRLRYFIVALPVPSLVQPQSSSWFLNSMVGL